MNWHGMEGNWQQMKGAVKEKWGKHTDGEFDQATRKRDHLVRQIQERYRISADRTELQARDCEKDYRLPTKRRV